MSRKRGLSSAVFITWMMVIVGLMLIVGTLDLEVFFVMALIGLLVIVILIDTSSLQPDHLRRMKYLAAGGILIFGYIVANRIMGLLSQ